MINNGVNIIMMLYLIIIGQLLLIKLQKNNKEKLIIKKLKLKPYIIRDVSRF